jgi:serine/threonine protein kinase
VDLWACGVILFILLSGNPPFYHEKDKALYDLIKIAAYSFQDPVWDLISDECAYPQHLQCFFVTIAVFQACVHTSRVSELNENRVHKVKHVPSTCIGMQLRKVIQFVFGCCGFMRLSD